MKVYRVLLFAATALTALSSGVGCAEFNIVNNTTINNDGNGGGENGALTETIGPDHDAQVQLADADLWTVPSLPESDGNTITWTLLHPEAPTTVVVRRTCTDAHEPFLWLSDPPDWNEGGALATFHECGIPGEFYSTIELAYDGVQWIGMSATGAATLLPPQ